MIGRLNIVKIVFYQRSPQIQEKILNIHLLHRTRKNGSLKIGKLKFMEKLELCAPQAQTILIRNNNDVDILTQNQKCRSGEQNR